MLKFLIKIWFEAVDIVFNPLDHLEMWFGMPAFGFLYNNIPDPMVLNIPIGVEIGVAVIKGIIASGFAIGTAYSINRLTKKWNKKK